MSTIGLTDISNADIIRVGEIGAVPIIIAGKKTGETQWRYIEEFDRLEDDIPLPYIYVLEEYNTGEQDICGNIIYSYRQHGSNSNPNLFSLLSTNTNILFQVKDIGIDFLDGYIVFSGLENSYDNLKYQPFFAVLKYDITQDSWIPIQILSFTMLAESIYTNSYQFPMVGGSNAANYSEQLSFATPSSILASPRGDGTELMIHQTEVSWSESRSFIYVTWYIFEGAKYNLNTTTGVNTNHKVYYHSITQIFFRDTTTAISGVHDGLYKPFGGFLYLPDVNRRKVHVRITGNMVDENVYANLTDGLRITNYRLANTDQDVQNGIVDFAEYPYGKWVLNSILDVRSGLPSRVLAFEPVDDDFTNAAFLNNNSPEDPTITFMYQDITPYPSKSYLQKVRFRIDDLLTPDFSNGFIGTMEEDRINVITGKEPLDCTRVISNFRFVMTPKKQIIYNGEKYTFTQKELYAFLSRNKYR